MPFYFINLLPTSLLYISILLTHTRTHTQTHIYTQPPRNSAQTLPKNHPSATARSPPMRPRELPPEVRALFERRKELNPSIAAIRARRTTAQGEFEGWGGGGHNELPEEDRRRMDGNASIRRICESRKARSPKVVAETSFLCVENDGHKFWKSPICS